MSYSLDVLYCKRCCDVLGAQIRYKHPHQHGTNISVSGSDKDELSQEKKEGSEGLSLT